MIQNNPITCVRYYNHKTFSLHKLMTKDHYFFGHIYLKKFVIEFQNCGGEHDHGLSWIKNVFLYKLHTNK